MSTIQERLRFKGLLRDLIFEKSIGDTAMASIVDRMSEYEAARAEYDKWAAEQAKYEKAVVLARQRSISPSNASAMLKLRRQFPEYDYDPKVLKKEKQVKDRLQAARRAARPEYNIDIGDLPFEAPDEEAEPETAPRHRKPEDGRPVYLAPSKMEPLRQYSWSDYESIGLPPLGGFDDSTGTHPGEERLAKIFGAERQGDSVSFDLVDQEGMQWEVKGLQKPSSLIRPGVEGIEAARPAVERLFSVVNEIESFVYEIEKGRADKVCDTIEQMRRFIALRKFIEREKKDIVRKEISAGRFEAIALALENVAALYKVWVVESLKAPPVNVKYGKKKTLAVPRLKLIKMLQVMQHADPKARELLNSYSPRELALSHLETLAAYDNPWDWMDKWDASIDVQKVFNVDGLIIVTPQGFTMVPRAMLRDVLELRRLSQDAPRYAFVPGGAKKTGP